MYLVFGGQCYYPHGGANDLIGVIGSKELAVDLATKVIGLWDKEKHNDIEWSQVYCTETKVFIHKSVKVPLGDVGDIL